MLGPPLRSHDAWKPSTMIMHVAFQLHRLRGPFLMCTDSLFSQWIHLSSYSGTMIDLEHRLVWNPLPSPPPTQHPHRAPDKVHRPGWQMYPTSVMHHAVLHPASTIAKPKLETASHPMFLLLQKCGKANTCSCKAATPRCQNGSFSKWK